MAFDCRTLADGNITLYRGDCMEVMEHLRGTEQLVDFVLTDPPYGINFEGAGHDPIEGDDKPRTDCIPVMTNLLKPNRAICLFTSPEPEIAGVWMQAMLEAGLRLPAPLIWHKVYGGTRKDRYFSSPRAHELLLQGWKGRPPVRRWKDGGRFSPQESESVLDYRSDQSIWTEPVPRYKRNRRHPTPKPPGLMERAMWNYASVNSVILDPFMGGAPVGVAAVRRGCRYIGIEMVPKYFNLAVENIQRELTRQTRIAIMTDCAERAAEQEVVSDDSAPTT